MGQRCLQQRTGVYFLWESVTLTAVFEGLPYFPETKPELSSQYENVYEVVLSQTGEEVLISVTRLDGEAVTDLFYVWIVEYSEDGQMESLYEFDWFEVEGERCYIGLVWDEGMVLYMMDEHYNPVIKACTSVVSD